MRLVYRLRPVLFADPRSGDATAILEQQTQKLTLPFDPVAEIFYRVLDDSGWRRESYNVKSIPAEDRLRRRFTSTDFLVRGK